MTILPVQECDEIDKPLSYVKTNAVQCYTWTISLSKVFKVKEVRGLLRSYIGADRDKI
jgi:hypothetical protein